VKQQNHSHSNTIITGAQFQDCPMLTVSSAEQSRGQVLNSIDWAYMRLMVWGRFVPLCSEIQFEQTTVHGREYCESETLFRRRHNGLFISGLDIEYIYFFHISIILLYHRVLIHIQIFGCLFLYVHIMTWFLGCSNNAVQEFYQSFVLLFYCINITFLGFIVQEL